jgi:hypothetical protein
MCHFVNNSWTLLPPLTSLLTLTHPSGEKMARHDMAGKEGLNSGTAAATSTSAPASVPAPAPPGFNQGAGFAMTRPLLDPENLQQSDTYQEEVRDGDGDDDEEDLYDASRRVLKRSVKRSTSVSMEAQSAPQFHITPVVDEEKKKKDAATNVPPGGGVLKRDLAYEKTLRLEEGYCLLPERFYFGSFSEEAVSKIPRK